MNVIIIAAGMGTRLNPLTLSIPKPLVKRFGKPMIEKNIEYLLQEGIEEIVIVTGYMKDMFEYLRDKYKYRCCKRNFFKCKLYYVDYNF